MPDLEFSGACGKVSGFLKNVGPKLSQGTLARCHCNSCRSAQIHLGQPDPRPDGVVLYQITPAQVTFDRGAENLAAFKLGPKGTVRWYATCCRSPIGLTAASPRFPFVSLDVARIVDPTPLGPVRATAFKPKPNGSQGHENLVPFAYGMLQRTLGAFANGTWRKNPFFDPENGKPVGPITVLTPEERAKLPLAG